jgi:hypothetical protein
MVQVIERLLGVAIPNTPVFAIALAIHVLAGLTCVVSGALAALSKKRPGRHPKAGTVYYWGMSVIFVTATVMAAIRWSEDAYLFALAVVAFSAATLGRQARRQRWRNWPYFHIPAMSMSYVTLLTAFYVDNGPHLPLYNRLPTIVFWVVPSLIGVPLIVRALRSRQAAALTAQSRRQPRVALP